MKSIFSVLALILFICSCGVTQSSVGDDTSDSPETIEIEGLLVMKVDLGKMTWAEAGEACEKMGDGWRLPTKDELNMLYENKSTIGGFVYGDYWSSTENPNLSTDVWCQNFKMGMKSISWNKTETHYARAVHDL